MRDYELSLESFEATALEISQEALDIKGSISNIKKKLPTFFNTLQGFVKDRLFGFNVEKGFIDERKFGKLEKIADYTELRTKRIQVPQGLAVTFAEHIETLEHAQSFIDGLMPDVLNKFDKYIGGLLANPEELKTQRETHVVQDILDRDIDSVKERVASDFSKDSATHRAYGELIERQRDWRELPKRFNELKKRALAVPPEDVIEKVNDITGHLDALIERMSEYPDEYKASGVSISDLARVSYLMANEVEFYAMHMYSIETLETSLEAVRKAIS